MRSAYLLPKIRIKKAADAAGPGKALPPEIRDNFEALFGTDFSGVRIHEQHRPCGLPYRAVTCGEHIYVQKGFYKPATIAGRALLAHELTHVIQQRAGRIPLPARAEQRQLAIIPELEREAAGMEWLALEAKAGRIALRRHIIPDALIKQDARADEHFLQPVVHIEEGQKELRGTFCSNPKRPGERSFDHLWPYLQNALTEHKRPLIAELKPKPQEILPVKNLLKKWVHAPETVRELKLLELIRHIIAGNIVWGGYYTTWEDLLRCLIGNVRSDASRNKEKELAHLIGGNNKVVSKLLTEGLKKIHAFHEKMKKDPQNGAKYLELLKEKSRPYASYYTEFGDIRFVLKKGAISVDDAFAKLMSKPCPSYQIIAFLTDYAKIVKEVITDYFEAEAGGQLEGSGYRAPGRDFACMRNFDQRGREVDNDRSEGKRKCEKDKRYQRYAPPQQAPGSEKRPL